MNRALLFLCLFLVAAAPKRPVIVTVTPAILEVAAGTKMEYTLELKILKGYHIQANPASQEYLIPVTAKLEQTDGFQIGKPIYPPGVPFRLKGSNMDISTYEGTVRIKIPLEVDRGLKPGEKVLKGTLRYQGCDAVLCFRPANLPLEIKLKVK